MPGVYYNEAQFNTSPTTTKMITIQKLQESISRARTQLERAFDLGYFDQCGIIQAGIDGLNEQIADLQEEYDYDDQQTAASFEPVEKPYRELPDGPDGYGSYESRFESWYAEQNQ